jgi:hypothetical protein
MRHRLAVGLGDLDDLDVCERHPSSRLPALPFMSPGSKIAALASAALHQGQLPQT